jgi:hypothetical protein
VADDTASYCEARKRLPEEVVWDLAHRSGQAIHDKADAKWLFQGRPVKVLDGSPPASRSSVFAPDHSVRLNRMVFPAATAGSANDLDRR